MTYQKNTKERSPLLLPALFVFLAAWLNFQNSNLIQVYFPHRTPIIDTLFLITPEVMWTQYLTDLANITSCILLGIYIFRGRQHHLPFTLTVIGFGYFLRSLIILLNPFGGPLGNIAHYGLTTIEQHGQFPSGHTLIVVLAYYLIAKSEAPLLKKLALISVWIEVVSLILSRGHWSVDVVGGFLLAYFAYHFIKEHYREGRATLVLAKGEQ